MWIFFSQNNYEVIVLAENSIIQNEDYCMFVQGPVQKKMWRPWAAPPEVWGYNVSPTFAACTPKGVQQKSHSTS